MIDELEDRPPLPGRDYAGLSLTSSRSELPETFLGAGIAPALIRHLLHYARERGYGTVITDCTSLVSKSDLERCGFDELGHSPYADFRWDGVAFFSGLPGGISPLKRDL
jgi:GNAT superfamily N-acetyltransferase